MEFEGAEGSLTVELWIGVEDLLLHQFTLSGELPVEADGADPFGLGALGEATVEIETVFRLSQFNEPVIIVAPEMGPSITGASVTEYQNIMTAVAAMMVDNIIATLPKPVTAATAPCAVGTQDMTAFPDTSNIASGDKATDTNGNACTDGVDPLGDRDGYVLFGHDITGDNDQAALVNYLTVDTTNARMELDLVPRQSR